MGGRGSTSGMKASQAAFYGAGEAGSAESAFGRAPFGKQQATDFMDSHNAYDFSTEQFNNITINGTTFVPINYATSGDRIINDFQASTPNSKGEYDVFEIVVKQRMLRGNKVYEFDRSSVGTKFA